MPALSVPMERASSAGSTTSTEGLPGPGSGPRPLTTKKGSTDLDKPRKHGRRRISLPVNSNGSLDGAAAERRRFKDALMASSTASGTSAAEGSTSASRRATRDKSASGTASGASGRRRRSMPASAREAGRRPAHRSTILRNIPQRGLLEGSAVEEQESEDDGSDRTLSPRAQSPDFDSSYAAGPSGSAKGESDGGAGPALYWMSPDSASDLETTDAETFGWDKVRRRTSTSAAAAGTGLALGASSIGLGLGANGSSQGNLPLPVVEEPGSIARTRTPRPGGADKEGLYAGSIKRSNSYSGRAGSNQEGSSEGKRNSGSGRNKGGSSGQGGLLSPPGNADLAQPVTPGLASKKGVAGARKKRPRGAFITSAAEGAMLLGAGIWACVQMAGSESEAVRSRTFEMAWTVVLSAVYMLFKGSGEDGMVWATDRGTYRLAADDGVLVGLLVGPLIAFAGLVFSLQGTPAGYVPSPSGDPLPYPLWRVEGPPLSVTGGGSRAGGKVGAGLSALTLSQCSLISLQSLNTTILLLHLVATRWYRRPHQLPVSRWRRFGSFVVFQFVATMAVESIREAAGYLQAPLFTGLRRWELITSVLTFQTCLHATSRLARKSFTLGELALMASVGGALVMETIHISLAKLLPASTPFVNTPRRPTPLLIFQLALIVGMLFLGFFLSPLLYLSRHLAQKPLHRLRWPDKRDLHRRLLAGFFYLFAAIFVVGVLGIWVRWLLGWRDPWLWTLRFLGKGRYWWSRPALIAYWLALVTASVAGWQAVVINAKRYRMRVVAKPSQEAPTGMEVSDAGGAVGGAASSAQASVGLAKKRGGIAVARGLNGLAAGVAGAASSTEAGGLTMKKAAHLSLNARRKFFHALAVLLFVPGIALDPAFTHLAFSLAFSAFILAEYVRYYALYPFGAALHVFLSEFTDHKDAGPVILSHFYLLAGCAVPVWLEAPSRLLLQMGVLVLGVGDALASIVGRRYGRFHWPASSKTVEGSAAFFASVCVSAWLLRFAGWAGDFSLARFSAVLFILSILEGCSEQNDNLVLPIYSLIAFALFKV